MVFQNYARFYDLLNSGKQYAAEAAYVCQVLKEHGTEISQLLDMGCGTGMHARELAELGFTVHGIDQSPDMLQLAAEQSSKLNPDIAKRLSFSKSDVREFRAGRHYDAVLALFHVLSYQSTTQALADTFRTAASHLEKGGLFLFDVWYGPAVLSQKPDHRERLYEDDFLKVLRKAHPEIQVDTNIVDVNYEFLITDKKTMLQQAFSETHTMRYLFTPEICCLAENCGMELIVTEEWLTGNPPSLETWSVFYVARKI